MSTFIEGLQQKSEKERVALATVVAVITTVLLFGVWGYNFAHSGRVQHIASSVASVSTEVQESSTTSEFTEALTLLKQALSAEESVTDSAPENTAGEQSVGAQQVNVFVPTKAAPNTYGDNPADILY